MQCHVEDSHWTGMDRNLVLAEKQYSVSYSMSLYLYRSEFTMMWLCGKHICALTSWNFIGTWDFEPTILLRRVLCMERLYIIWGYSVAM